MRYKRIFWDNVKSGSANECWNWQGRIAGNGYGYYWTNGKWVLAHRTALSLQGVVINNKEVRHTCDNPTCCNPNHLIPGTHWENMQDCIAKGRFALPTNNKIYGERNGRARITTAQAILAKKMLLGRVSVKEIAHTIGCSISIVYHIRSGNSWAAVVAMTERDQ